MKTITNSNQWMRNAKTALPAPIPALALILSLATACTNQELPGATDATTTTADTRTMTITATMADDGDSNTDNSPELLTLTAGQAPDGNGVYTGVYGIFYKNIKADGGHITSGYYPSPTSSINLALEGITWGADGFTAHMMMLPTDLNGKTFTVSVRCKDGTTYRYTTPQIGKKYVAGMRYTATIPGGNNWTKATGETNALVFNNDTKAADGFASGSGSEAAPYIIATAGQLKYLVEQVNKKFLYGFSNKYLRLATDIKVEGTNWTPIGLNIGSTLCEFCGHFDGNDHTIYGTLTSSDDGIGNDNKDSNFGFFGNISQGGSVRNLHIKATVINAYAGSSSVYTGGLAGTINTNVEISGCSSDGEIQGGTTTGSGTSHTGGLIGFVGNSSTISNCTVSGKVTAGKMTKDAGLNYTGGVAGYISGNLKNPITIQSCTNHAKITGSPGGGSRDSDTGGIAGHTSYTSISRCTNHGQVTAQYTESGGNCYVGGLIGMMETNTNLSDSENQGAVTGGQVYTKDCVSCCGGLAGQTQASATATNCTNSGTVSGNTINTSIKNYTGGLVGRNYGTLHQCLNTAKAVVTGETSAGSCTGGLVGYNVNKGAVYNCCTNLANVNNATPENGNRIGGYDSYEGGNVKACDQGHTPRSGNK